MSMQAEKRRALRVQARLYRSRARRRQLQALAEDLAVDATPDAIRRLHKQARRFAEALRRLLVPIEESA